MKNAQVGWGVMALFLGMLIPVMHHVLLYWPVAQTPTSNVVSRAENMLGALPWMDWAYLVVMTLVGLLLVLSGIESKHGGE